MSVTLLGKTRITTPFFTLKQEKIILKIALSTFISGMDLDSWATLFPLRRNDFLKVNLSIIIKIVAGKQRG